MLYLNVFGITFVMPIAPTFSLYDVTPLPEPHSPANMQHMPSTPIPIKNIGGIEITLKRKKTYT